MTTEAVLAALYLRGAPRPTEAPRRGWPEVLAALRREGADDPVATLRAAGMPMVATILEASGLLQWAEEAVQAGAVLTVASATYPSRWFEALGDLAPPALWRAGDLPCVPWVGAVGSRQVEDDVLAFMSEVGARTASLGYGIVSGGAAGCDSAAERACRAAGGPVMRLLPHGLRGKSDDGAVRLALAAPGEPFSTALAMERNALIYAAAGATTVGHARMRQGGTWHGATDALRRRLGRVLVRPDGGAVSRVLIALGAEEIEDASQLGDILAAGPPQRTLFVYERRRRRAYRGSEPL